MTESRYARLVAKALARGERREQTPFPFGKTADDVALIEHAMSRKAARERARMIASACAAAFVVAGGTFFLRRSNDVFKPGGATSPEALGIVASSSTGTIVRSSGSDTSLEHDTPLVTGSRLLVGPGAGTKLTLSTGTRVAIDPGTNVAILGQGRAAVFGLDNGSLLADVAKLADDERFVVQTADSEVEVRGTSFRVTVVPPDPACGNGTATRVKVYEGIVTVRQKDREEARVRKGEEWPRDCARAKDRSAAPPAPTPAPEARTPAWRAAARPARVPADVSTLAEQNDQFSQAMIAKRTGDTASALAAFERFLAKHPASSLAENAAAERMTLLAQVDRTSAISAARQYLAKYPSGFARADAQAILALQP